MYFWDIESLKEDIRRGEFTDKDLMPYIVLSLLLYTLGTEFSAYFPYENMNIWTYLLSILNILITLGGTLYVYKRNGGKKGKDFASKYFSIGFVVGLRFLLYFVGVMVVLIVYWSFAFENQEEVPTTFLEVILSSLWYVLLYYNIAKHTEETNTIPTTSIDKKPKSTYKILKWFFGSIFILFLAIISYFVVPYYYLPDDLNENEASKILNTQIETYCKKPYVKLISLVESEPNYFQIKGDTGTDYQIEVELYKDEESDDLTIYGMIDNGNRSAYHPMVNTLVKQTTEACIKE